MFSKLATATILSLGLATGALAQVATTPNDQSMMNNGIPNAGTTSGSGTMMVDPSTTNSVTTGTTMNPNTTLSSDGNCSAPVSVDTVEQSKSPVTRTQC
jgi:hypothetical protein